MALPTYIYLKKYTYYKLMDTQTMTSQNMDFLISKLLILFLHQTTHLKKNQGPPSIYNNLIQMANLGLTSQPLLPQ